MVILVEFSIWISKRMYMLAQFSFNFLNEPDILCTRDVSYYLYIEHRTSFRALELFCRVSVFL